MGNNEEQSRDTAKENLQKFKKQMQNEGKLPKDNEKPEPIDQYKSYF